MYVFVFTSLEKAKALSLAFMNVRRETEAVSLIVNDKYILLLCAQNMVRALFGNENTMHGFLLYYIRCCLWYYVLNVPQCGNCENLLSVTDSWYFLKISVKTIKLFYKSKSYCKLIWRFFFSLDFPFSTMPYYTPYLLSMYISPLYWWCLCLLSTYSFR